MYTGECVRARLFVTGMSICFYAGLNFFDPRKRVGWLLNRKIYLLVALGLTKPPATVCSFNGKFSDVGEYTTTEQITTTAENDMSSKVQNALTDKYT